MLELVPVQPVDYLAVGHIAMDVTPSGLRLGGSAAYAALTARALGLRVGMVTANAGGASWQALEGVHIVAVLSSQNTTFENIQTESGRIQILHHRAQPISLDRIPQIWRHAPIVHLAPIARELDANLAASFTGSFVGLTPQGWMRAWDETGRVAACAWENSEQALRHAGGVVLSTEDVQRDLERVEAMSHHTRLLCLTEGEAGAVLYWNGDRRRFRPPLVEQVDSTGAGDIFAAAFFVRLHTTRDPWEAARFATQLAARSVTRAGLAGIPTHREIEECLMEVLS